MKIVFFGDSITDMSRRRDVENGNVQSYGDGFVFFVAGELLSENPNGYEIVNRGVSGDRIYQLYARLKKDVWNENPDVLSILVGINDVESPFNPTGTDIARWEKIYRMLIEETKERLPNIKIMLCEPFTVYIDETLSRSHKWRIETIEKYKKLLQTFVKEYDLQVVWLHDKINQLSAQNGAKNYLYDGTHPSIAGSKLIADEWLKTFRKIKE